MEWLVPLLCGLVIAGWAVFVIVRKVRRIRKGIYCDCCDGNCSYCRKKEN